MNKKTVLIICELLFICNVCICQTAMYQYNKILINNDTAVMVSYPTFNPCKNKEQEIIQKHYDEIMTSTLLKAIGVIDYKTNIKEYFDKYLIGYYKEWIEPIFCFDRELNEFLHKIIKIKKVREFGLQQISSLLCDFCRLYPKDFKTALYVMLYGQKIQIENMKKHTYEAIPTRYDDYTLYVDGKEEMSLPYTTTGFFIRRIIIDGIPREEIIAALDYIIESISKVNVGNNPDYLCKTIINNEVEYQVTTAENYYYFRRGNDTLYTYNNMRGNIYEGSSIKYFKDKGESFYQIENGYSRNYSYKKEWIPFKGDNKLKILLDNAGNEIYRE